MSMVLSIGSTSPVTGETQTTFLMTNRNNETEEKMEFFSLLSAYLARDGTQKVSEIIQEPVKTRGEPPQEKRETRESNAAPVPKPVSIKGKKANEEEAPQNTGLEKAGSAVTKKEAMKSGTSYVLTNNRDIISNNEEKSQEKVIIKNGEEIVLKNVNKQEKKKVIKDKITLPIEAAELKIPKGREAQIESGVKEKKQEYPTGEPDKDPLVGEVIQEPVKTREEPPQELREIREIRENSTTQSPKPVSIKGKKANEEEASQNTDLEKAGSAVTKKEAIITDQGLVFTNSVIINNNEEKSQEEVIKKNGEEIVLKNVNKQEEKKVIKDKITLPIEPAEFKIPERREAQIEFEIKEKKQEYPRGNSDRDPLIGETKKEPVKTGGEPPREIREIREKRESNTAPVPKPVSIKGKKVVEEVMHNSPNFETTGIPGKEKEVEISLKTEDKSVIKNMLSTPLELIESKIRGTPIKDNKQGFIIGNPVGDNDAEIETNGKHSGQIPETLKTPIIKQVATGQKFVLASNSVFYKRSEAEVTSYGQKHKYASFEIENISHDNGEIMHFDMKYSGCKSEDADNVKEQNGRNGSRENETSFETGRLSLGQEVSSNLSGDINESIEKTAVKQLPAKTINFINSTLSNQKPRVLQLQMEPEHLGRVKVTLNWTKGNLSARFYTENVEAAHAVQKSLEVLKQNLDALNINVTNLAVSCFDQSGKDPLYSGMRQIFGDKRSRTRQNDTGLSFPGKKSNSYVGTGSHAVNFLV
jgi:hypothetical protein